MRSFSAAAGALALLSGDGLAQAIVEPEACILNTLKGGGVAKESNYLVHLNCVRQYIRSAEAYAVNAPVTLFQSSTIFHYAAMSAIPTNIAERLVVQLKNDSQLRIIYADILALSKSRDAFNNREPNIKPEAKSSTD